MGKPVKPRSHQNATQCNAKLGVERVQALADISRSALCCHSNETRAPIPNPSTIAQLEGTPTIPQVTSGSAQ